MEKDSNLKPLVDGMMKKGGVNVAPTSERPSGNPPSSHPQSSAKQDTTPPASGTTENK